MGFLIKAEKNRTKANGCQNQLPVFTILPIVSYIKKKKIFLIVLFKM